MREVSKIQRVLVYQTEASYIGDCEFCGWEGTEFSRDALGKEGAQAQAREHLGNTHPERVTYWDDDRPVVQYVNKQGSRIIAARDDEGIWNVLCMARAGHIHRFRWSKELFDRDAEGCTVLNVGRL